MLLDAQNLFSDNQEITTGTIYSTNTVRFGKGDISNLPLIIQVVKAFSVLTKLSVKVQTSETEDFSTAVDLVETTLTKDELIEGAKFPVSYLPKGNKGYIRLAFIVPDSETETDGLITSGVVAGV